MKNKDILRKEIMKRVMVYEKKKLMWWYQTAFFVLITIVLAEVWVAIGLISELKIGYLDDFRWIFYEDLETMLALIANIVSFLWFDLPWLKVIVVSLLMVSFVCYMHYFVRVNRTEKERARQIRKFEEENK